MWLAASLTPWGARAGVSPLPDLPDMPLEIGAAGLFGEDHSDGRASRPGGTWRIAGGRLDGDELVLPVEIDPPEVALEIESGPAVLFAGLLLYGDAGGDIGAEQWADGLGTQLLPSCRDDDCHFTGEIRIPMTAVAEAVDDFTNGNTGPRLMSVQVQLTLVRTFGAGTWLQVLPFGREGDPGPFGTVANPPPSAGDLFPYGLFPAAIASRLGESVSPRLANENYRDYVEPLRRDATDKSRPLRMAPAFIHVQFSPECNAGGSSILAVETEAGDVVWDARHYLLDEIDDGFAVPVDVPFTLTLHGGDGIDGAVVKTGGIVSDGSPISIGATFDCSEPLNPMLEVTTTAHVAGASGMPTSSRAPAVTFPATVAPTPGTLPGPGSSSADRGAAPFIVLAVVLAAGAAGAAFWLRRRTPGT